MEKNIKKNKKLSASFVTGAVALVFIILGYQIAIFVHKVAVTKIVANHDSPDTVYVYLAPSDQSVIGTGSVSKNRSTGGTGSVPKNRSTGGTGSLSKNLSTGGTGSGHNGRISSNSENWSVVDMERKGKYGVKVRRYESFRFNPNTVSVEDLQRLGFSEKQAESIDNYRKKGGRFNRKSDFAKSFVVSDSVFRRLEPYIDIPRLNINQADSAAFDALPGIGPYFASEMVKYRQRLGGYSAVSQLLEIWNFGEERYDKLKDLVFVDKTEIRGFGLWSLPADSLRLHPHIRNWKTAKAVVMYRENSPKSEWTVEALCRAGILTPEKSAALSRCKLANP